jgi:hypothetical protein
MPNPFPTTQPYAPIRVSHLALTPSHRLTEHLGLGLAPPPRSRMSHWHQQLCSRGRRRGYWPQAMSRLLHWAHPQFSTCPTHLPQLLRPYHPRGWTVCQPSHAELCVPTCSHASCMTSNLEKQCTLAPMPLTSHPACKPLRPSWKTQTKQGE